MGKNGKDEKETVIMASGNNRLLAMPDVQVSKTFFGWSAQSGSKMWNISPDS